MRRDFGIEARFATLKPNTPDSTTVWCPVCNESHDVSGSDCNDHDCPGNVIAEDGGYCLNCGEAQDEDIGIHGK
jgi:hypothetical protein